LVARQPGGGVVRTNGHTIEIMTDDHDHRISGWLQRHSELVWYALGIVFFVYGISALFNLLRGVPGPDDSNWISTFGGFIAAVAGLVIGLRASRDKREHPEDD
jgi:hypothetical protein